MKTIKLLTFVLSTVLFLSVSVYAQSVDGDSEKSSFVLKALEEKTVEKNNSEKFGDTRFAPKAFENADWTRKSYNQDYTQGKIQTH